MLVHNLGSPRVKLQIAPGNGGQGGRREEKTPSDPQAAGLTSKKFTYKAYLQWHKIDMSMSISAARILEVFGEAFPGSNHIEDPKGLNNTHSQGSVLQTAPILGMVCKTYMPKAGDRVRSLWLPRSSSWVTSSSWPTLTGNINLPWFPYYDCPIDHMSECTLWTPLKVPPKFLFSGCARVTKEERNSIFLTTVIWEFYSVASKLRVITETERAKQSLSQKSRNK